MWFFGLIVVLLIGAVAVVASGRWGGMSPAYDDRPDMSVPARQALTAADLETARFGVGLRGYRMDEVDTLLERVAREVAERDRRIADLERAVTPILHGPEGAGFTSRSEYSAADFDDTGFQEPILVGGDFPEPTPAEAASPEQPAAEVATAEPATAEPASPEPAAAQPASAQAESLAAEPAAERAPAEAVSPQAAAVQPAAAESAPAQSEAVAAEPAAAQGVPAGPASAQDVSAEPPQADAPGADLNPPESPSVEPGAAETAADDQPAVPADPAAAEPAQASVAAADTAPASAAPVVPAGEVGSAEAAPQPVAEPEQPAAPLQHAAGESEAQPVAGEGEQQGEREQHDVRTVLDDQPEPPAQVPLPPLLQELVHTNYEDEPEPEPWFQAKEPPPDHTSSVETPVAAEDEPGVNGDEATRARHSAAPDVNVPQRPN